MLKNMFKKKEKKPKLTYKNAETDLKIMEEYQRKNHPELYKKPDHICIICHKTIEGEFETAGNMFGHTLYNWHIVDKHPIIWDDYCHWECFITTEEGKKYQEDLIKNKEKEIEEYKHYKYY